MTQSVIDLDILKSTMLYTVGEDGISTDRSFDAVKKLVDLLDLLTVAR